MWCFPGQMDFISVVLEGDLLLKFSYNVLGLMPNDSSSQNVFKFPSRVSSVTSTGFTALFRKCCDKITLLSVNLYSLWNWT